MRLRKKTLERAISTLNRAVADLEEVAAATEGAIDRIKAKQQELNVQHALATATVDRALRVRDRLTEILT